MSKLSLDALKERAEATASNELLATISGGTANVCHDTIGQLQIEQGERKGEMYKEIGDAIINWWNSIWN